MALFRRGSNQNNKRDFQKIIIVEKWDVRPVVGPLQVDFDWCFTRDSPLFGACSFSMGQIFQLRKSPETLLV